MKHRRDILKQKVFYFARRMIKMQNITYRFVRQDYRLVILNFQLYSGKLVNTFCTLKLNYKWLLDAFKKSYRMATIGLETRQHSSWNTAVAMLRTCDNNYWSTFDTSGVKRLSQITVIVFTWLGYPIPIHQSYWDYIIIFNMKKLINQHTHPNSNQS